MRRPPGSRRTFRWPWRRAAQVAADVDAELAFHLAERADALRAAGAGTGEARVRAEREFGDVAAARGRLRAEGVRHARRERRALGLDELRQDVRGGWRALRRRPAFTAVAVATLALGIGASATIFGVVDAVLLRPLPYADPGQLVAVWPERAFSAAEVDAIAGRTRTVRAVAAWLPAVGFSLSGDGAPEHVPGARVTANLFDVLGVRPALGRAFLPGEDRAGGARVALLADGLWRERYGADPRIVGRRIRVDGEERTVVGVMPPGLRFPANDTRLWVPVTLDPAQTGTHWGIVAHRALARLAPGVPAERVHDDVLRVMRAVRTENPLWTPDSAAYVDNAAIVPLREEVVGDVRRMLLVLLGAVGFVLLIACVNVANLLLAHGVARGREIAIRGALGAGRGRLVRQLLTESVLLALLGGAAGVALAALGLRVTVALLPADTPRLAEVALDGRVLAFALLAGLATSVLFGLLPALRVARPDAAAMLRVRGGGGSRRGLSAALVVVETALAVVLVTGAGLLLQSVWRLQRTDPGFRTAQVVTARLSPPSRGYGDDDRRRAFHGAVLARAAALPDVQGAALASQLPFDRSGIIWATAIEGVTTDPNDLPVLDRRSVTPDYFRVLDVPLRRGRPFTAADDAGGVPVAIVDEAAARRFWPGQDPIGRRVGWPWANEWRTVVGVVGSVRSDDLAAEGNPAVYVPFAQSPQSAMTLVLRTARAPGALAAPLRAIVAGEDADVPVSAIGPLEGLVTASMLRERLTTLLLGAFALVALLLGAVGLYGVIAYEVSQRTQEIGVRMALGARAADVVRRVLGQGVALTLAGTAAGLAGALALTRVLGGLLHGVSATDPLTFAVVPVVLLLVAVLATLVPARRAAAVDPVRALRSE